MKKSIKKTLSLIILSIMIMTTLVGCGGNEAKPAANGDDGKPEYVIKYATSMKATELESVNPGGVAMTAFKEYVEKETNGKVQIQYFLGGQLATSNEERVNGLQSGAYEMENLNCGSWSEYSKAFIPLNAPYLFLNADVANKAMDGDFGNRMNEDLLADTGIRNLGYVNIGFRQLTNSIKEVKTPEDVKGLKIRTMSDPYQVATWQALGAAVTPTAYSELYTALQQGMVDGQENPLSNLYTSGMYEIQEYLTLTNHNASFTTFVINDDFFNSLPKEYQDVLVAGVKHAVEASRGNLDEAEKFILDEISEDTKAYELSIDELKLFRDATDSVRETMLKNEIGEEYYNFILDEIANIEKEMGL